MLPGRSGILPTIFAFILVFSLGLAGADFRRLHDLALQRHGQQAAETIDQWQTLINDIKHLPDDNKLVQVNDFFNTRIRFVDDIDNWGKADYWATPLQTIGLRRGDCEDFSIAKYVTLLLAGVNMDKLRMTYVRARIGGPYSRTSQAHMVLTYYRAPSAEPLVLDNMVMEIRPASLRTDLTPVFGFNSRGLWVGVSAKPASRNPGARLSRWRDLLLRMQQDGLQ